MGLINYLKETKIEMKRVTWPTVRQTVVFTIGVIVTSLVVAIILGFFEYLFSQFIIQKII